MDRKGIAIIFGTFLLVGASHSSWETEIPNQNHIPTNNGQVHSQIPNEISERDSYAELATEYGYPKQVPEVSSSSGHQQDGFGSSQNQNLGPPRAYHYAIYPHYNDGYYSGSYYSPQSNYEELDDGGWLCRTFTGICDRNNRQDINGTLGILGLIAVGLKKLKLVKLLPFFPLFIPFLPILLPLLLILAIPVLIAVWFLPLVPVVVVGRSLSISAVRRVQETLLSDHCLERISCEATRISRKLGFDAPWIHKFLEKASPHSKWVEKISRAGRRTTCKEFKCRPVTALQRAMNLNPTE